MAVLEGLEPKNVWTFFEELCGIPHGSGNLRAISDHLVAFAKERGLEVIQDEALNVIIKKPASAGYEGKPPVILQGHMDMVAVCTPESGIDMKVTPLQIYTEGDRVRAKDTSLGGDDGVAVAMCMAVLDSDDLAHPPLEVVITTEEETGMDGARALDASHLSGKRLINLDSEDEGVFMVGCAGGARFHARYMYEKVKRSGMKLQLTVGGLKGGHSGVMIHEERGNANVLLARILYTLYRKMGQDFSLCSVDGGVADNAIPANASAVIVLPSDNPLPEFEAALKSVEEEIAAELKTRDPGFAVTLTDLGRGTFESFDESSMKHAIKLILSLPNGVQAMSPDVKGLVETSLNLGTLQTDGSSQTLQLSYAVRSSVESAKNHLNDRLRMIAKSFGAVTAVQGSYPGWQYAKESPLRDLCVRVFEDMYGKTPVVEAIHAGVECGFFAGKIPGLDCISLGPDMEEIHSTGEALSISSTKRVYEYLCELLKAM
ncbi:MAG: aminoacyl-histidine dipeptidase [Lachnospiraceae bacterium]|nr:aminoacyl-histidine dipeptidase [Lachnospiraceae bacterium]